MVTDLAEHLEQIENPFKTAFVAEGEDSSNWNIETSSNLDTWNTIGILNTREMDNLDEKYRIGEFMIDNIKKKKKEFVRIRSID